MSTRKNVLLITTTHLAKNPRLVKEINSLSKHYNVQVIFFQYLVQYLALDEQIISALPAVKFHKLIWTKKYFLERFVYTLLQKFLSYISKLLNRQFFIEQQLFAGYYPLYQKSLTIPHDIIHGHNPGSWAVVCNVAKKKKTISSFDLEDFHRGEYKVADEKRNLVELIEAKYFPKTEHLIAASALIAEAYGTLFGKTPTIILNTFPKAEFRFYSLVEQKNLRLVWFSQIVGKGRGLEEVIMALNQLTFKVEIDLYGEYSPEYQVMLSNLISPIHQLNFKGLVSSKRLNQVLSQYDIGLASEMGFVENRNLCLTNKIFSYIQAGLFVLVSDTPAQIELIKKYPQIGAVYRKDVPSTISGIITELNENIEELRLKKRYIYSLGQTEICWEIEELKLLAYFHDCLKERRKYLKIALSVDPEIPVPPKLYGGIERIVYLLVEELTKRGHEIVLFAHPASHTSARLIPWNGSRSSNYFSSFLNILQIYNTHKKENFDIIHSFSRLLYLSLVLKDDVRKVMSYQREPTLKQVQRAAYLAKNGTLKFTGCSKYISQMLNKKVNALTIYNAVNPENYAFQSSVAKDAPLIFLGRIEEIKGTHYAIELAKLTGRNLWIAGNIPLTGKNYFDEKILPFLDHQIRYFGEVNDEQKNKLLGESAAMIMPILWDEPFGIVMIEAMACGTPIIAFNRGSVQEIITDGKDGFICDNIDDMIKAVQQIHTIDRNVVNHKVISKFTAENIVEQYEKVYFDLIKKSE